MGDIRRGVSWAIERGCSLRTGSRWELPNVTHQQLADIAALSNALGDRRAVDDICVTGYTYGSDSAKNVVMLPYSGFRISLALAPFGGEDAVRQVCGKCEANVTADAHPVLANCHGFLEIAYPDFEETEKLLQEQVMKKGLGRQISEHFPITTLLWYGFWIESPLRRPQCEVLLKLFTGMDKSGDPLDNDLRHFLAALRVAIDRDLPLHVSMNAPGHGEGDYLTIFAHCPRCKAGERLIFNEDWQNRDRQQPIICHVCHQTYVPAETGHHESIDASAWTANDLRSNLTPSQMESFTRSFLAHRGSTPEQIEDILDRENDGPLRRRILDLRRRQAQMRKGLSKSHSASKHPGTVLSFDLGDGVRVRMRLIPKGEFLMGSAGAPEEVANEGPQHCVRIARPFYLGEFPITRAQFAQVMRRELSQDLGDPGRPVDKVSWFGAQEFCLRLAKAIGRVVRLPSEAEWEYACRAGTTERYHFGDEASAKHANCKPSNIMAAFLVSDGEKKNAETNIKGRFSPNAWGLFDMHGNVQEWCEDEWHDTYEGAPTDGSAWITSGNEGPFRLLRGGSCWHHAAACTSTSRQAMSADTGDDTKDFSGDPILATLFGDRAPVGFRIVVEID